MYKLKFYGLGGQGVVTAGKLLCHALCMYENKFAKTIPAYGHERRGAPVFTDLMVDDHKVLLNSFVYDPDIVIVFTADIEKRGIDITKGIKDSTILVINADNPNEKYKNTFKSVFYVDGTKISIKNTGVDIPNIAMLAGLAKAGVVKIQSLENTVGDYFGGKNNEIYKNIIGEAYETTTKKM